MVQHRSVCLLGYVYQGCGCQKNTSGRLLKHFGLCFGRVGVWGKQSAKVSRLLLVVKIEQKLVDSIVVVDTLPGSCQMWSPLWGTSGSTIREIQGCSRWKIWMPTHYQLELLTCKLFCLRNGISIQSSPAHQSTKIKSHCGFSKFS